MIPVLSLTQVRFSKFAVLFGDVIAFGVAFAIATLINVSIDANQNIALWFSTQDKERYLAWFGLAHRQQLKSTRLLELFGKK